MEDKTIYTEESIQSLDPRSHVMLRPGMYLGSTHDTTQLIVEIFSNALDEHNLGHGNEIVVAVGEDDMCLVGDKGQGFPIEQYREDGKTVLQAAFDEMNTSGKYSDDGVYGGTSLGLNGVGAKATNFTSLSFDVVSWRDGRQESVSFQNGVFVSRQVLDVDREDSGTNIFFKPDPQFFDDPMPNEKYLRHMFNDICCMCPNLTIRFKYKDKSYVYHHPDGITDLLTAVIDKQVEIPNTRLIIQEKRDRQSLDCGLTYTSSSSSNIVAYVNYGLTEQGPHITAIKGCLTKVFNKWAREQQILKPKESNLDGAALQEGLNLVFNLVAPNISYDAQTKQKVVSKDFVPFLNEVFSNELERWLDNNPADGRAIIEKAVIARRASEAAKKAREAVKNQQAQQRRKKVKILHPDKLKDAEYLGQDSTLLCVEGLSAGASVAVARDPKKYGILMLRGKLINAFTNKESRLMKNEEIQLLLQALDITPGHYDSKKLRYGKVGICVDQDSDGRNIGLLIMCALQHFCPEFIQEGRLCWLQSPLYIVKTKDGDDYYYTDAEMNEARREKRIKGEVQRNKGLGSLSSKQARESMFGPRQRMEVMRPDDTFVQVLNDLMGSDVEKRRKFIFNNIDFSEVKE